MSNDRIKATVLLNCELQGAADKREIMKTTVTNSNAVIL
jgi:hypothetical protein